MTKKLTGKLIVAGVIALLILLFLAFDLHHFLTLASLKERQAGFDQWYRTHPAASIAIYMVLYILITALSLPGAAVMTLAGGALFGLITGTIAVSFASTIGATLACLAARFLLRDWVQRKFGNRLALIQEGMTRDGGFYLFTLRLVPIFPFFIVNLLMGLTGIRLSTYYWVSQLGMLPATLVYVNAGKEIAKIDSLAGILSPGLVASFALLGFLPLATKKLVELAKRLRKTTPADTAKDKP